jgi:hypothetical protein
MEMDFKYAAAGANGLLARRPARSGNGPVPYPSRGMLLAANKCPIGLK